MSRANLTSHDLIQLSFAWQIHGSVLFFSICLMGYYLISDILKQKQCIYLQKTKYQWQWPAKRSANRGKSVLNLPTFSFRFSSYLKESSLLSENWTGEKRTLPNTYIYLTLSWSLPKMAKVKTLRNFLILFVSKNAEKKKILRESTAKEVSIECSYHRIQNLQPPCETATFRLAGTVVKG